MLQGVDRSLSEEISNYQAERRLKLVQDDIAHNISRKFRKQVTPDSQQTVNDIIVDLATGGEAGLMHMGAIVKATGFPIRIFNEQSRLVRIVGSKRGSTPVEVRYIQPNTDNPSGHYTLNKSDANKNYTETQRSGDNNCLFDVVSVQLPDNHILKGRGALLRQYAVANMGSDKVRMQLAAIIPDITRLQKYNKAALIMGGRDLVYGYSSPGQDLKTVLRKRDIDAVSMRDIQNTEEINNIIAQKEKWRNTDRIARQRDDLRHRCKAGIDYALQEGNTLHFALDPYDWTLWPNETDFQSDHDLVHEIRNRNKTHQQKQDQRITTSEFGYLAKKQNINTLLRTGRVIFYRQNQPLSYTESLHDIELYRQRQPTRYRL